MGAWSSTEPVNKAGDTPLSLAYQGRHWKVVKYLSITHHCDTTSNSDIFLAVVNDLLVFIIIIIIMLFMDSTKSCNFTIMLHGISVICWQAIKH